MTSSLQTDVLIVPIGVERKAAEAALPVGFKLDRVSGLAPDRSLVWFEFRYVHDIQVAPEHLPFGMPVPTPFREAKLTIPHVGYETTRGEHGIANYALTCFLSLP